MRAAADAAIRTDRLTGGPAIEVRDVRKSYGDVRAVDGISFDVAAGEIFGLLGPNGAGKTTTMEMLEGLHAPDAGELRVLGLDVARQAVAIKERIGAQLQTAALFPQLTVEELLALFSSFYRRRVPAADLLAALDLEEKRKAQSKNLSGGQRQRLSVALALVNDPEVVFLDEPTTGLDPAARRSLWDTILDLKRQGRTVLMTTHYLEEAEAICDRVAIMDHGRLLDIGTPEELISRRFHERAIQFDTLAGLADADLAALPAVARVSHEDGATVLYTRDVPETISGLLAACARVGGEPDNLLVRRATLEDVFLALTGRALRD
ncbi:MAG TPA: ABC transporter ATP-binding protein [Candidatus Limnocylindrales bacterium]|nr:ABC transporter ATP-binding protein [Candidatus Limnocylindrales bacterium]